MLRDPLGERQLQVFEQNYRSEPLSHELLLSMYEGKTLNFQVQRDGHLDIVAGKIIRSGYVPHQAAMNQYGYQYYQTQMAMQSAVALRDRETKQVEFIRASRVATQRLYVYDGAKIDWNRYRG
jgi:hypothetical protein